MDQVYAQLSIVREEDYPAIVQDVLDALGVKGDIVDGVLTIHPITGGNIPDKLAKYGRICNVVRHLIGSAYICTVSASGATECIRIL